MYRIVITKEEEKEVKGTPQIQETEIYNQRVEELDLVKVIKAVNEIGADNANDRTKA